MWTIKIINTLFPPSCFVCKKEGGNLCDNCLSSFKKPVDSPHLYIQSFYSFKDKRVKDIIHAIKYHHRRDLILPLIKGAPFSIPPGAILIPIPMPRLRKYMRGYNQAEYIAKEMSEEKKVATRNDILIRSKNKKRQVTTKTRGERIKNQKNSFDLKSSVTDMNIILVDDVTTTGSTLDEARKVLLKNGARSVNAITLAH